MIVYILIGIVIGGAIGFLFAQGRSRLISGQNSALAEQVRQKESEAAELNRKLQEEISLRAKFEADAARIPEQLALLEDAKARMSDAFGKLSKEALSENAKEFRQAAHSDFETRTKTMEKTLDPVKENLAKLEEFNRELERSRTGAYASLEAHIKNLVESEQFLRTETSQLVKALRQPASRGTWGEQQLRRVLEIAGMEEHVHFSEQVAMTIGDKNLRADLVLHMADGKHIVVDSKAPVEIYMDIVNATTKEEQTDRLKSLVQNIKSYGKDLQSKEYWKFFGDSPGVVVMFIPGESILNAAMQFDPTLWDECVHRRVLLASPTTLIAILYSIAFGWRQDSFEKNAEQIRKIGEDIYTRLSTFGEHLQELGKLLGRSVTKYNETIGSLDHTVLPSARKMKDLGISSGKKVIPDLTAIDTEIRSSQAPELFLENGKA